MSGLYTSYETSIRLKEEGAPQKDGEKWAENYWWVDPEDPDPPQRTQYPHRTAARSFRADEIVRAIKATGHRIAMFDSCNADRWSIDLCDKSDVYLLDYEADSLVEALAAAWIAVLETK